MEFTNILALAVIIAGVVDFIYLALMKTKLDARLRFDASRICWFCVSFWVGVFVVAGLVYLGQWEPLLLTVPCLVAFITHYIT